MHVTILGADRPGKWEVAAKALEAATVVVDDRGLAVEMGAVGGAGLGPGAIHAELGEVLAGARPGRRSERDVTVFGGVGLAFQDLAAGWLAYALALERGPGPRHRPPRLTGRGVAAARLRPASRRIRRAAPAPPRRPARPWVPARRAPPRSSPGSADHKRPPMRRAARA
jgi:hypothetical protein